MNRYMVRTIMYPVNKNILLLLDEYTPFKEVLTTPSSQSSRQLHRSGFTNTTNSSSIRSSTMQLAYNHYIVMNYHNEMIADSMKTGQEGLLLLDFGKFDKDDFPISVRISTKHFTKHWKVSGAPSKL